MIIPFEELSEEALSGVISEFVLREGTDYGHPDYSLDGKIEQVRRQLKERQVFIVFDSEEESLNIIPASQVEPGQT